MFDNLSISRTEVPPAEGVDVEPVSVADAKAWMQIDFDDHDDVIAQLVIAARQAIENYCSISLVPTDVVVYGTVTRGLTTELPYGPVRSLTSVSVDATYYEHLGTVPDVVPLTGYWRYHWLYESPVTVSYLAGYEEVPQALKQAILTEVDYRFHNRGSNEADFTFANRGGLGVCQGALELARPYKRMYV